MSSSDLMCYSGFFKIHILLSALSFNLKCNKRCPVSPTAIKVSPWPQSCCELPAGVQTVLPCRVVFTVSEPGDILQQFCIQSITSGKKIESNIDVM